MLSFIKFITNIFIKQIFLNPHLIISEGIYFAENWFGYIEISNRSNNGQTIYIEQPIKVANYSSSDFIEVNNFNIRTENYEPINDIAELIRTAHLNNEEKRELIKVCK